MRPAGLFLLLLLGSTSGIISTPRRQAGCESVIRLRSADEVQTRSQQCSCAARSTVIDGEIRCFGGWVDFISQLGFTNGHLLVVMTLFTSLMLRVRLPRRGLFINNSQVSFKGRFFEAEELPISRSAIIHVLCLVYLGAYITDTYSPTSRVLLQVIATLFYSVLHLLLYLVFFESDKLVYALVPNAIYLVLMGVRIGVPDAAWADVLGMIGFIIFWVVMMLYASYFVRVCARRADVLIYKWMCLTSSAFAVVGIVFVPGGFCPSLVSFSAEFRFVEMYTFTILGLLLLYVCAAGVPAPDGWPERYTGLPTEEQENEEGTELSVFKRSMSSVRVCLLGSRVVALTQ